MALALVNLLTLFSRFARRFAFVKLLIYDCLHNGELKLITFSRWRGSVYKLVWRELLAYLGLYYTINFVYRYGLNEDQKRQVNHMKSHAIDSAIVRQSFVVLPNPQRTKFSNQPRKKLFHFNEKIIKNKNLKRSKKQLREFVSEFKSPSTITQTKNTKFHVMINHQT